MVDGETTQLDDYLDDSYTLVHITGYAQPKTEWLHYIHTGQMRCHSIENQSLSLLDMTDATATVVSRNLVDATIYGTRSIWCLQLQTEMVSQGESWTPVRTVATTF